MKVRALAPRAWVLALAATVGGCSEDPPRSRPAPADERADLGGAVAARVSSGAASEAIALSLVARVAADRKVSPTEAARLLVDDAVAAVVARERGLDVRGSPRWQLRSARARMTVDRIREAARAAGPPTDEEVTELSARHWREVDRPPAARVVHFVVLRAKPPDPTLDVSAKALAEEMRAAVVGAASRDDFMEKAKAFPRPKGVEVSVEKLPAITDDGWSIEDGATFDATFSKAAHAIAEPGGTSPVIETPFGWHVLRLLERVPEQRMPLDARRIAFTEEAYAMRARRALEATLAPLRAAHPVRIESTAEPLMRSATASEEQ